MAFDFRAIEEKAEEEIAQVKAVSGLEELRIKYLGRRGILAEITSAIPGIPPGERPGVGKDANNLKNKLKQLLEEKAAQLKSQIDSSGRSFDSTIPGIMPKIGTVHPISSIMEEICSIFNSMGFAVVEGPEMETEYNNFTGLNIPLDHPSRDAFDTFYLKSNALGAKLLLRSHTSPGQVRVMKQYRPPLAVVVPGKVYRPDAVDASHSFMFHQVEGFLVDEEVRFSDLKGVLNIFLKKLFNQDIKMRFRPHFFPFTEPSAEVDMSCILCGGGGPKGEEKKCSLCHGKGWLEILGSGMIHPNVFANVGYPKGKYTGFAFGMGVDRIAMLKYGIDDIRLFYENDLRFLKQF